jgi:hypothetical protein
LIDYFVSNEPLLLALCASRDLKPDDVQRVLWYADVALGRHRRPRTNPWSSNRDCRSIFGGGALLGVHRHPGGSAFHTVAPDQGIHLG